MPNAGSNISFTHSFIIFTLLVSALFITACERLEKLDRKVGEALFNEQASSSEEAPEAGEVGAEDLTARDKARIDRYLIEAGYNRYGDKAGMTYVGGTPLFDPETGESIDRYDYILEQHPGIMESIGY